MPRFAHFRLWLREGPTAERWGAALASVVVLALLALAIVPVSNGSSDSAGSAVGPAPGATFPTPTPGVARHHGPGRGGSTPGAKPGKEHHGRGVKPAPGPHATTTTGPGKRHHTPKPGKSPTAEADTCAGTQLTSAQGVTPTEVKVDVAIVQLAGAVGNAAFNIPTNQIGIVSAVTNYINHHGGLACGRKLVTKIYKVNPIDSNNQQSNCLKMVQDKPIAVINTGAYVTPVSQECFIRNHLPLLTGTSPGAVQARESYPYLFSPIDSSEQQVRNGILGSAARGYFKKTKKIALFQDNCLPSVNTEIARDLAKSGIKPGQITRYTLTCELVGSPTQILQAVARAKAFGADTVFLASSIFNNENFVSDAGQQDYHPRFLTSDYGSTTLGSGSSKWAKNFDGAIAITSTHSGELNSGVRSRGLKLCNEMMRNNKQPQITNENAHDAASGECDQMRFMAQAIDNAGPNPSPLRLIQQLQHMSRFYSAYIADSTWSSPGQVTGNTFQRAIQYHGYCRCWKVLDRSFGSSY